jgi:uncharacterized coiled-coil protein SlyX
MSAADTNPGGTFHGLLYQGVSQSVLTQLSQQTSAITALNSQVANTTTWMQQATVLVSAIEALLLPVPAMDRYMKYTQISDLSATVANLSATVASLSATVASLSATVGTCI